jgi:hypothetical protein
VLIITKDCWWIMATGRLDGAFQIGGQASDKHAWLGVYISRCNCGVHGYDPSPCVEPRPKNKIQPPGIWGLNVLVGLL